MKQLKQILGVTLLEIMLVLAIAAMIIIMSVRYYQTATSNQQQAALTAQLQAVTAAADQYGQGATGFTNMTTANVARMIGLNTDNIPTPWATAGITIGTGSQTSYPVTVSNLPAAVCVPLAAKLTANTRYVTPTCTNPSGVGNLTYTYDITK